MSILRKVHRTRFTTIDNSILTDGRLSFKARGIAAYLLSKPDSWEIQLHHLVQSGPDGKSAIRSGMAELIQFGYMRRVYAHDEQGHIRTVTELADWSAFLGEKSENQTPDDSPSSEGGNTDVRLTDVQKTRTTVKPNDGKPGRIVKTDLVNTEKEVKTETTTIVAVAETPARPHRKTDPAFASVCEAYEQNIGMLTDFIGKELGDAFTDFGAEKVIEAIRVAALAGGNRRNMRYIAGVLRKWESGEILYSNGAAPNAAKGVIVPTEEGAAW